MIEVSEQLGVMFFKYRKDMMVKSLVTKMTTKQQNLPVENNILTIARCCHLKGQNKGKDHILFQTLS